MESSAITIEYSISSPISLIDHLFPQSDKHLVNRLSTTLIYGSYPQIEYKTFKSWCGEIFMASVSSKYKSMCFMTNDYSLYYLSMKGLKLIKQYMKNPIMILKYAIYAFFMAKL